MFCSCTQGGNKQTLPCPIAYLPALACLWGGIAESEVRKGGCSGWFGPPAFQGLCQIVLSPAECKVSVSPRPCHQFLSKFQIFCHTDRRKLPGLGNLTFLSQDEVEHLFVFGRSLYFLSSELSMPTLGPFFSIRRPFIYEGVGFLW